MPLVQSKSILDLVGNIISVRSNTAHYDYPAFGVTLEEAWLQLRADIDQMRRKLTDARADQLLDMLDQARKHFQEAYRLSPQRRPEPGGTGFESLKLGSRLMQDIEWVARGRKPFAYPRELYRWPLIPGSREAGDPNLDKDFTE